MPHSEPQSQQLPILYAMGVPGYPPFLMFSNLPTPSPPPLFSRKEKSFREIPHFSDEKSFFAKIFAFCLLFQKLLQNNNAKFCVKLFWNFVKNSKIIRKKRKFSEKICNRAKEPWCPVPPSCAGIGPFKRLFIVIGWIIVIVKHMLTDRNLKVR